MKNPLRNLLLAAACLFPTIADAAVNVIWSRNFGGPGQDPARSIQPVSGGGFMALGSFEDTATNRSSFYFVRLAPNGDTLWTRSYTLGTRDANGQSLAPVASGGFIAVGSIATPRSSIWLARLANNGDTLWTRQISDANLSLYGLRVRVARNSDYVVSGTAASSGLGATRHIVLVRVDGSGNTLWRRDYSGDAYLNAAEGADVIQTSAGGFAVCGGSVLVRTDSLGNQIDYHHFETWVTDHGFYNNALTSLLQLPSGAFAVAGYSPHPDYFIPGMTTYNAWMGRADTGGRPLSTVRTYGLGKIYGLLTARTGGFALVGSTSNLGSQALAVRTDSAGQTIWSGNITGSTAYALTPYDDSTFVSAGTGTFPNKSSEAVFVRFGPPVPVVIGASTRRRNNAPLGWSPGDGALLADPNGLGFYSPDGSRVRAPRNMGSRLLPSKAENTPAN